MMFYTPIVNASVENNGERAVSDAVPMHRSIYAHVNLKGEDFVIRRFPKKKNTIILIDPTGGQTRLKKGKPVFLDINGKKYEFVLTRDFSRPDDAFFINFVVCSAVIHLVLAMGAGLLGSTLKEIKPKADDTVDVKRIQKLIEKVEYLNKVKPKPKPKPKPKVLRPPGPARGKRSAKRGTRRAKPRPSRRPAARPTSPRPGPKGPGKPLTTTSKAVQKGPSQAQAKARVAKSLNFLSSSSPSKFNVAKSNGPTTKKFDEGSWIQSSAGKSKKGSALSNMSNAPVSKNIKTRGARNISSGKVFNGRAGGGDGKSLNAVQGRVALNRLYDYGEAGGGEMGGALGGGGGGLSMSGSGKIPKSLIEKALAKKLDEFQYCYEKALLSDATLSGNIMMGWTINVGGKVSSPHVVRSQMNNKALHKCLAGKISSIRFPSPKGGSVKINYPFSFSSSSL